MYVCMYDIVQQQVESVSKMEGQLICLLFFMVIGCLPVVGHSAEDLCLGMVSAYRC